MLILIYIASVTYELMTTFGNEISLGVAKSIQIPHKNLILRYFQRANPAKSENDPPGLAEDSAAPADPPICRGLSRW